MKKTTVVTKIAPKKTPRVFLKQPAIKKPSKPAVKKPKTGMLLTDRFGSMENQ